MGVLDGYNEGWENGIHWIQYFDSDIRILGTDEIDRIEPVQYAKHNISIKAGAGNDSISGSYGFLVYGEAGDDYIDLGDSVRAFGGTGNDCINVGDHAGVDGGDGDDDIGAYDHALVSGGEGNDAIWVYKYSYAYGGNGNDNLRAEGGTLSGDGGRSTLEGGAGNDYLYSFLNYHGLVDGGSGDDTIRADRGREESILGGEGNDYLDVSLYNSGNGSATIEGGEGNDTIKLDRYSSESYVLIEYCEYDGHDVIYGASSAVDKLHIDAPYNMTYTQTSEQAEKDVADLIFITPEGSITFKDLSVSEYLNHPLEVIGDKGGRPMDFVYGGGNAAIANYSGQKVKWASDYTGIGFSDKNFMINSSSGTMSLQNARDKVIDVSNTRGKSIAYAYMSSGGGDIDGRGFSQLEVVLGGDNAENVISAGEGGSSLWGGAGSVADTLNGGGGVDYFFAGKTDGSDVINYASKDDRVMLYNVGLSDISSFTPSQMGISLTFNTGSAVTINDTDEISPIFQLADGSCWKFNHSTNNWESG